MEMYSLMSQANSTGIDSVTTNLNVKLAISTEIQSQIVKISDKNRSHN